MIVKKNLDALRRSIEKFLTIREQAEVITIPQIILTFQDVLNMRIQIIEIHIPEPLACIVAYGNILATGVTVYDVLDQP